MNKDPLIFVRHILESIELIEEYCLDKGETDFLADRELQDAVARRLEIIGEAVKNLPPEITKKYPAVPWAEIAKMRDKLIHAYFGTDLQLTFRVVTNDLPPLKKEIKKILK